LALLSLSDKTGAVELAGALVAGGARILASAGTARHLEQAGVPVTPIESRTGFAELLGGRVKTLHPHVHAPILARRSSPSDLQDLAERGLEPVDLVAVTLYPFEERAAALDDALAREEIDIGGVALLRAAAKNHPDVIVVCDPADYSPVLAALQRGEVTPERRLGWALKAFARTARYDAAIASDLERRAGAAERGATAREESGAADPPLFHVLALERVRALRYGENPDQRAALYARAGERAALEAWKEGRELSYNNLLDLDAAVSLVWRFEQPACVIVKHLEPCGAAEAASLPEAYEAAHQSDPLSAFGGIVAFNRALDPATAALVAGRFVECVAAPELSPGAAGAFESKKNVRLLRLGAADVTPPSSWRDRAAGKWFLLQSEPAGDGAPWRVVTERAPSEDERKALAFAWQIVAAARSNAVALARGTRLVGLGSGQTSRVDAVDLAVMKARRAGHDLDGAALASDGFFPFADNIEHAAEAGVTAIVQPGGSMRDAEVIAACDARGLGMVFTDRRVFRH
jgi:phosphoribosylaminoimidazolecarboxamide formyltransferase/IMP cyclohydrolase